MASQHPDIEKVLFTQEDIDGIVSRLGEEITRDYAGKDLVLIAVLRGAVVFMGDLMRKIELPTNIDFMAVSSYGDGVKSSGIVRIIKDLDIDITEGVRPGSTLVVNTDEVDYVNSSFENVAKIDANKITHEMLGEVPPNVAMLGALAKATGCVSLDSLMQAVKLKIPGKAGELNAKTCAAAYENA